MDIRDRLAKNLRQLRQDKGWSQEAFADEADLHRTYISDLERGARNPTSRATEPSVPTMAVVVFNTALVANVPVISETVPVKRPRAQYREPIPD